MTMSCVIRQLTPFPYCLFLRKAAGWSQVQLRESASIKRLACPESRTNPRLSRLKRRRALGLTSKQHQRLACWRYKDRSSPR